MRLTAAEKRDLIVRVTDLVKNDILSQSDRDGIFRICLAACNRELSKIREEREKKEKEEGADRKGTG